MTAPPPRRELPLMSLTVSFFLLRPFPVPGLLVELLYALLQSMVWYAFVSLILFSTNLYLVKCLCTNFRQS